MEHLSSAAGILHQSTGRASENADVLTFLHCRHHHKLVKGSNTQNHSCASKVTHIHKRTCSQKHKTQNSLIFFFLLLM